MSAQLCAGEAAAWAGGALRQGSPAAELKGVARKKPLVLSAVAGRGVKEALTALAKEIGKGKTAEVAAIPEAERKSWQP